VCFLANLTSFEKTLFNSFSNFFIGSVNFLRV
jgi:hypothetical protein